MDWALIKLILIGLVIIGFFISLFILIRRGRHFMILSVGAICIVLVMFIDNAAKKPITTIIWGIIWGLVIAIVLFGIDCYLFGSKKKPKD